MVQRLATIYSCYAHRNDLLAPLRAALPANVQEVGFVACLDDTDYSLGVPSASGGSCVCDMARMKSCPGRRASNGL